LVCQALIAKGVPWLQFYFGSLVLSAINTTFLVVTFKPAATEFLRDREYAVACGRRDGNQTSPSEAYFTSKEVEVESPITVEKKTPSKSKSRFSLITRFLCT
jgi:hypothetical protein